jgi:hypothetical protein
MANPPNQFTEAVENAPNFGPFPFSSLRQQHCAPQKSSESLTKTTIISEKGEYRVI